jgi:hypothetical protein
MLVKANSIRSWLGRRTLLRCAEKGELSGKPRLAKPPGSAKQKIAPLPADGILIHHNVSWMWNAKTQVFGCVDVAPGRISYWTPGRKNSEGVSWKA